jgi:excisionase family DNA binding protein
MVMIDQVEMIGVREAARLTRRTPETVRRWVWSGRLQATKQGNRLYVSRTAVAALVGTNGESPERVRRPTLSEWASRATTSRAGTPGASAADLVWDDRAGR